MILCGQSGHGVNVARTSAAVVAPSSPERDHVQRTDVKVEGLMSDDVLAACDESAFERRNQT